MQFIKPKLVVISILCVLISDLSAFAEEKKAEEGKGEGTKEASSEGGSQREYNTKFSKLNSLNARIEEADKRFAELVHEKNEAKSQEAKQAIIKEMVEVANRRNKDVDQYNQLKAELTYRFPNQGEHQERHYNVQNKRSVEEMDNVGGLDEQLTYTKKLIDKKYAPFMAEDRPTKPIQRHISSEEEKPHRLRLEK